MLQITDVIFLIFISALFVTIFYFVSNDDGQKQQQKLVERTVHNSFISVLAQKKSEAILLYQLQYETPTLLSLLDKANQVSASPEQLTAIQNQLAGLMAEQFEVSRKLFSHQQLYLKNGQTLVHLDQDNQAAAKPFNNPAVQKTISTREASFGLGLRNGQYQYSYLFPIFNERNYFAGVVEFSIPLVVIQRGLKHALNGRSQFLFTKRLLASITNKSQFYEGSDFDELFYIPRELITEMDKQSVLMQSDLKVLKMGLSNEAHTKLLQMKRNAFSVTLDDVDGIAVFIPIYDVQGEDVGGFLSFVPNIHLTLADIDRSTLEFLLLLLSLIIILYIFKKSAYMFYTQVMYQRFIDAMPFPIFLKYDGSRYLRANDSFYQFFNIAKKKLVNKKLDFDSEPEMLRVSLTEINEMGGRVEQEYEEYRDGQPFTYKIHFYATKAKPHTAQAIIGYVQDITEKKRLNASLQASIFDQSQFMDLLPLGIRVFNIDGDITYINKTFEKLSGYQQDDFLNQDCTSLFSCLQCDMSSCPLKMVEQLKKPLTIETIKYNKNHEAGTFLVDYQPYYSVDKELQGVIEITRDISKDKSLLDKNQELMLTDELTGLFNSRGLYRAGENYLRLAVRANKPFFVLYVDIYGLTKINEQYGEQAGDYLLESFSHILTETFRETDIVARVGGDEFVILMNDSDYQIIDNTCFTRLDKNVNKFNEVNNKPYSLVIDMGIVKYQQQKHQNLQALVNEGEELVYEHRFNRTLK